MFEVLYSEPNNKYFNKHSSVLTKYEAIDVANDLLSNQIHLGGNMISTIITEDGNPLIIRGNVGNEIVSGHIITLILSVNDNNVFELMNRMGWYSEDNKLKKGFIFLMDFLTEATIIETYGYLIEWINNEWRLTKKA